LHMQYQVIKEEHIIQLLLLHLMNMEDKKIDK
jgi:hypothetical protein